MKNLANLMVTSKESQLNNDELLAMLRCPQDRSMLSIADEKLVLKLNRAIQSAKIVNMGKQKVKKRLDGGLLRSAGDLLYPIVDGIPILLSDEAIEISQLDGLIEDGRAL